MWHLAEQAFHGFQDHGAQLTLRYCCYIPGPPRALRDGLYWRMVIPRLADIIYRSGLDLATGDSGDGLYISG